MEIIRQGTPDVFRIIGIFPLKMATLGSHIFRHAQMMKNTVDREQYFFFSGL